jgi:hypothetical protein
MNVHLRRQVVAELRVESFDGLLLICVGNKNLWRLVFASEVAGIFVGTSFNDWDVERILV